jgi:tetrahydromethanopterin S-methyltransferase subunit B
MKSVILDPENSLHSPRDHDFTLPREIKEHVDSLEEWLDEMENTLQPLPLNSRWSKKAISEKMKELKVSSHLFVTMQIIYAFSVFCDLCVLLQYN